MFALLFTLSALAQTPDIQVDLHLDTPTQMFVRGLPLDAAHGLEAGLPQLRAGGSNVVVEVLWPARKTDHKKRTFDLLAAVEQSVQKNDDLVLVRTPTEARATVANGQVAVLLSIEGAHGLGGGADWADVFQQLVERGLRLMGITWSFSNRFAGSSGDGGGGLSDEGRALVRLAREQRVILDVSHASRQTTMEICEGSPVPVIASHSNAKAVRNVARNLTDDEIRCIAKTGGVIGLNFHATFVSGGDAGPANVSRVADHADYLAKVGGHQVVALGSDFDGYIKKPAGLENASKIPALWAELKKRGWTEQQVAGVRGENFMRAWDATQKND